MGSDSPTVFVVDDHAAVRQSVSLLVKSMGIDVESFASATSFLRSFSPDRAGCLILDLKMPDMGGMDLLLSLVDQNAKIPVIIVSGHGDIPQAVRALKLGAIDFLEKPYPSAKLEESIRNALEADAKRRDELAEQSELAARFQQLTTQELAVLNGILAGDPTKKIASSLDVSLRTVQFRRESVMKKLGVSSRSELVRLATSAQELLGEF